MKTIENPCKARFALAVMICAALATNGCDKTESDWKAAKATNTEAAYVGFLTEHPQGPHADEARIAIDDLEKGPSVAKSGASYMGRIGSLVHTPANPYAFPPTAAWSTTFYPVTDGVVVASGTESVGPLPTSPGAIQINTESFWRALSGNLILPTDTRYAWVPFYSRSAVNGVPSSSAQITVIAVRCRNTSVFSSADLTAINNYPPNLQGRPLIATFTPGGAGPDSITFFPDGPPFNSTPGPDLRGAVAEGTYVIVADDHLTPNFSASPHVTCNNYVYRVGNPLVSATGATTANTWELTPTNDMKNARYCPATTYVGGKPTIVPNQASQPVRVYVVGRGYADPKSNNTQFVGPAMDISVVSTFIKVQ